MGQWDSGNSKQCDSYWLSGTVGQKDSVTVGQWDIATIQCVMTPFLVFPL